MTVQEWLGEDNKLGIDVWNKKYRFKEESFDEWLDRVSSKNEKVKNLIVNKKFLFGGRILSNINTNNGQGLSNCTTFSYVEDSLDDIMDVAKNLAVSYKKEAGVGIALSKIRPKGAIISGQHKSDGVIGFLRIFNSVTENIKRGGARRGAMLAGLHCDHPDVLDFIKIKKNNKGSDGEITSANLSVLITDEFMEHYIKNESYRKDFIVESTGQIIPHIVDTVKIMNAIIDTPKTSFEPGILFVDRYKEGHLFGNVYDDKELFNNACHTYDSLLLTDKGYIKIGELAENKQTVNAWNGFEFSEVSPFKTSDSEKIYEVVFSDGSVNMVTGYHKFHLNTGIKRTHELKVGDRLAKFDLPIIDTEQKYTKKQMYTQGFYSGDGTFVELEKYSYAKITLCGEKVDLFDRLDTRSENYKINEKGYMQCTVNVPSYDKLYVPINASVSEKISFLSGLFDSDGNSSTSVRVSSTQREFLLDIKLMLSTMGVKSTVRKESDSEYREFNGKKYLCNPIYTLTIPMVYSQILMDLGLDCGRIELKNPISNREISPCVVSITEMKEKQATYCATEHKNHTLVVNGVMSGNCSEFIGAKGTVCLLGSMNLSAYVEDEFGNSYFDFKQFAEDVKIAVEALDMAHDYGIGKNGLDIQNNRAKDYRGIGLGIMGLADMFMKLGLKYGSKETVILSENIAKLMREKAIEASVDLGKKFGQPKGIIEDEIKLRDLKVPYIKGLRNNSLLSIAPAGSISLLLNISTGIEPVFRTSYVRKTESLMDEDKYYEVFHKPIQDIVDKFGYQPDYCIDTRDVSVEEKVDIIAAWQKYVDLSISNTTNFKDTATVEEIKNLYTYGWKKKVKGLTVYVDGSIEGVLNDKIETTESSNVVFTQDVPRGEMSKVPADTYYIPKDMNHGCGRSKIMIGFSPSENRVVDVYHIARGEGGCTKNTQGEAILMSQVLRLGGNLEDVKKSFRGIESCMSCVMSKMKGRKVDGINCPNILIDLVINTQNELKQNDITIEEIVKTIKTDEPTIIYKPETNITTEKIKCPECGAELSPIGGCWTCYHCGYSKCD